MKLIPLTLGALALFLLSPAASAQNTLTCIPTSHTFGGPGSTTVKIAATDSMGDPVSGLTISHVGAGGNITVTPPSLMTDAQGCAAFSSTCVNTFTGTHTVIFAAGAATCSIDFQCPPTTVSVPTLPQWGMGLLVVLLTGFGVWRLRASR